MGTKLEPGPFDCYANALDDEPMFLVLARDPSAPALVRGWAQRREQEIIDGTRPQTDLPMVREAFDCASEMVKWRLENDGRWRVPPPISCPRDDIPF